MTHTSSANNPYIRAFQRIYPSVGPYAGRFYTKKCSFFGLLVYLPIVFNDGSKLAEVAFKVGYVIRQVFVILGS